ncbi:LPS O-antigen chain length determinant protein WzzB [Vagococcus sp. WN89Y]|uniref:LPS O-antigen chain length determinant protein WzzB n=1 Tax=Vagococcus sp. WN89Y TaxID=3457258 RepID=UPI003FCCF3C1
MSYENNNVIARSGSEPEQIDLIDLLIQLWRGKWTIAIFIILGVIIAGAYLSVAKEKWTSTAVITMPDAGQIADYTNAMRVLSGNSDFKINDIQQQAIGRFSSAFSALAATLQNQEEPEKLTLDPSVTGQPLPLKVIYQAQTAKEARQKLAQYIQRVDEQVAKELDHDLRANIKSYSEDLAQSLATQEKVAEEQKALRLKQIALGLTVARDANIQTPQVQQTQNVTQDTLFLLGSAALDAMIKNEASRPLVFSDDYYKTRQHLLDIRTLVPNASNVHAYRYVMKPDLPLRKDSPKRALIMVLAVLLGGMIGAGVVLARNAVRNYRSKA